MLPPTAFGANPPENPSGAAPVLPAATVTQKAVSVRGGSHADYGRLVFETPPNANYHVSQDGDRLTVDFADAVKLSGPVATPRNVISIQLEGAQADLVIAAGATFRATRLGQRVVIDILDPHSAADPSHQQAGPVPARVATPPVRTPRPAARGAKAPAADVAKAASTEASAAPEPAAPAAPLPVPVQPSSQPDPGAPMAKPGDTATPIALPAGAVQPTLGTPTTNGPVSLLARRADPPAGTQGAAFAVPFPATVGAAVFRRGNSTFVVFDERRPIDLIALRVDPMFGSASVQLLPSGTLIRLHPPSGLSPTLLRSPQGWTIALMPTPPRLASITPDIAPDHINFPAEQPSDVVAVADPDSGATWLVGTQRQPGQGLPVGRRTSEFALLPTAQGVVVEPLADSIALRVVPAGFSLTGAQSGLAVSPQTAMSDVLSAAASLTRRFDFPPMPTEALAHQLTAQINAAAIAPPQSRGPKRRAASIIMIALGLTAEAEALLQVAAEQDPKEAASPDTIGLKAIAALLAYRPEEAGGLADPRLTGTDDVALWRAIKLAMTGEGSPEAASVFVATAPLAFAFPPAIRNRVLPLVMETMVQGGERAAAGKLLAQRPDDHRLGFARALLAQANGDIDAALHLYDALANDPDQLDRARSVWRAVELRLANGQYDAKQAADALDKVMYAWRGDGRDLALRERLAELRIQSGDWRSALRLLREAAADFTDQAPEINNRLHAAFATLLGDGEADKLPALDLIALMDENADLLPATAEGDAMKLRLADRLVSLDLPKRADPLLEKLMLAAPSGEGRAGLGMRLARLRLREGDTDGALAALGSSSAADLPPAVFESRSPAGGKHLHQARGCQGCDVRAGAARQCGGG